MEVILLRKIKNLGNIGDIVSVKDGFGRNYLVPNNYALRSTKHNKELFEQNKQEMIEKNNQLRDEKQAIADKISGLQVIIVQSATESGKLYGSVSPNSIITELKKMGYSIEASSIIIEEPIKSTGIYNVIVELHPDVITNISVSIHVSDDLAKKAFANLSE